MKKFLISLAFAGLLCSCGGKKDAFSAMEDPNFKVYCQQFDTNQDGKLSAEECNVVTTINVSGKKEENGNITSLKGIELFTNLDTLKCSYNQLTTLDLSKNVTLVYLSCDGNQLTTLDVSKNLALKSLQCSENQLSIVDVSQNLSLEELICSENYLSSLDVSSNDKLTVLKCDSNQLTTLDLSNNIELIDLNCSNNQLSALDLNKNEKLTVLYCLNNQLTKLNLSMNLKDFSCAADTIRLENGLTIMSSPKKTDTE